jgi:hypothetical protein
MILMQASRNVRHSFTASEYGRLKECGVFAADARVELIRGEIMDVAPQGSEHAGTVAALHEQLASLVQPHGHIRCGMPLLLDERSQPEPDLAIVVARGDHYRNSHPAAQDVLLLIEVADKALVYDRRIKASLYAAAQVPVLWVVNPAAGELQCMTEPGLGGYRQRRTLRREDRMALPAPFSSTFELSRIL